VTSLPELVERIHAADPGPRTLAAFDYDGTLITGYSAQAFYDHRIRRGEIGPVELARTLLASTRGIHEDEDFDRFLELSLGAWKGRSEKEMLEFGTKLFRSNIASRLHSEVWRLVQAHQAMGHTVVLASSATRFQVEPMAEELGVDEVLCTPVEVDADGRLTGRVGGRALWGRGKADALVACAERLDADLDRSFAYSNGREDVPFLELAGFPAAVCPDDVLRRVAEDRGWPILDAKPRGGRPGPVDVARTAGMWAGLATGLGAGIGLGLLRRSRKTLVDVSVAVGAEIALQAAGIDVEVVEGEEHLWSSRPCVFLLNHQSQIDVPVMMKLLRQDFTGVAKKEAKYVPIVGPMLMAAGVAFLDRGNTKQAKDALAPAVRRIREEGISLAIAPEGTRSPTPKLAPFKKGAFHIAMQAEVPIVPIVLRNAGEVMWRSAQTVRPGTVQVAVLPPVDTSDWTAETLADHVEEVRNMYLEKLAHWPGEPVPPSLTAGSAS